MKIKRTLFIYVNNDTWSDKKYDVRDFHPKTWDHLLIGSTEVEIEFDALSDSEMRDKKVDSINQQIEKVKADTEVTLERLRGEISKLMAIEPPKGE